MNETYEDSPFELIETSLLSFPPPIDIVKLTALRTDEKDKRIAKIKIPIEIPLGHNKDDYKPNWDQRFGSFEFFTEEMISPCFMSLFVELNASTTSWLKFLKCSKKI